MISYISSIFDPSNSVSLLSVSSLSPNMLQSQKINNLKILRASISPQTSSLSLFLTKLLKRIDCFSPLFLIFYPLRLEAASYSHPACSTGLVHCMCQGFLHPTLSFSSSSFLSVGVLQDCVDLGFFFLSSTLSREHLLKLMASTVLLSMNHKYL